MGSSTVHYWHKPLGTDRGRVMCSVFGNYTEYDLANRHKLWVNCPDCKSEIERVERETKVILK